MDEGGSPGGHRKLSTALVVVGTLVTLLAIFSIWANRQLLNTDNWVSTSDRLLTNENVDERLANYLAEEVFTGERLEAKLEETLPPRLAPLASVVAGGLHGLAPQVAERLLEAPKFQELWSAANRRAHEELLQVLDGGGTTVSTANGTVTLDLRPLIESVGERVGVSELGEQLPVGAGRLTIIHSDELEAAQKGVKLLRHLPIVLTLLALILFGLAIWLAGPRRREALRAVGLGFVVAGALVLVLRSLGGHYVVDALAKTDAGKPAFEAVWEIATSLLATVARSALAFGVLVFLAAWVAGPTGIATALRREAAPYVRANQATAYFPAGALFLILVAWAPVEAFRKPLGILLLALLIAAGAELLRRQIVREFPDYEGGDLGGRVKEMASRVTGRGATPAPAAAPAAAPAPVPVPEADVAQLERLATLHREGDLSDEEYAQAKAALLQGG
ncbi:MAG TPA: SHOCT domain-containing protein [Solirubrobacterales bacterium]|jgi:hypothetical protein